MDNSGWIGSALFQLMGSIGSACRIGFGVDNYMHYLVQAPVLLGKVWSRLVAVLMKNSKWCIGHYSNLTSIQVWLFIEIPKSASPNRPVTVSLIGLD